MALLTNSHFDRRLIRSYLLFRVNVKQVATTCREILKHAHRYDPSLHATAKAHALLALTLLFDGAFEAAKTEAERAIEQLKSCEKPTSLLFRAIGHHSLCEALYSLGDRVGSVTEAETALDLTYDLSGTAAFALRAELFNNRGVMLRASRSFEQGLSAYENAMQCASHAKHLAVEEAILSQVTRFYLAFDKVEEAQTHARQMSMVTQKMRPNRTITTPYVYEIHARVAMALGNHSEGLAWAEAAITSGMVRGDRRVIIQASDVKSLLLFADGLYQDALKAAQYGITVAEAANYQFWIPCFLKCVASCHEALGEPLEAYPTLLKLMELKDRLFAIDKEREINALRQRAELETMRKEVELGRVNT